MYSMVLMTALTMGQSSPAEGYCHHGHADWCATYGTCYGGCYGACYGGYTTGGPLYVYAAGRGGSLGFPDSRPYAASLTPGFVMTTEGGQGKEAEGQPASANRARLIVSIPDNASLYVDGKPIQAVAPVRSFQTPELEQGREYFYEVRAEVMRDGKPVSETRRVTVKAGEVVRTDFRSLAGAGEALSLTKR